MLSVRRSLVLSLLEKYILIGLSLVSYVLVARILTPEEIGLYSIAAALIGIAQVLREFGIGSFLIQARNLSEAQIRTAFGLSLILGTLMFLIFVLGAPLLGSFYDNQRVIDLTRVIALNFLVMPFCSISTAMLRREMKFDRLLKVNTVAAAIGVLSTLSLIFAGFGPFGLALGTIACNLATGIGAWLVQDERRIRLPSLVGWRELTSFGGQSTLGGVVTSVAMDVNDLVVGKVLGFAPVAILSRALGLMNLFHRDLLGAVKNVAYPAFAKAHREGQDAESLFVASMASITALGWPFYGFLALFPLEVLRLLAGPQWDAAAPLVPIYAAAGALLATVLLVTTLITAVGRVDLSTRADVIVHLLRMLIVIVAAVQFQTLIACAVAYLLSVAISVPIFFVFKGRCVQNHLRELFHRLVQSLQLTLGTLAGAAAVSIFAGLGRTEPIGMPIFLSTCLVTAVAWLATVKLFGHPIGHDPLFKKATSRIPFFKD